MGDGSIGQIGAIMLFIVFIVMWFIWLGAWVAEVGEEAIIAGGLTGIEAFCFANLNFIVLICLILGMLGWMYFGGNA